MKPFLKQLVLVLAVASATSAFQPAPATEAARWKRQAANVTIVGDAWGRAHGYGETAAPAPAAGSLRRAPATKAARWKRQAANVTIVRDDWGIAHVYGKTDADAVFGILYTQAEDDFNRVETNYLNAMGRLAETEGP